MDVEMSVWALTETLVSESSSRSQKRVWRPDLRESMRQHF